MDTKEMTGEKISALVDGELDDEQMEIALAALREKDGKSDWDLYHQIGDVLRSDDMAVSLSPGFGARMSARLEAEPTIVAPVISRKSLDSAATQQSVQQSIRRPVKRWALPGMLAAAAMATVAFVTTPQLMVAMRGDPLTKDPSMVVSTATQVEEKAALVTDGEHGAVVMTAVQGGVVLRDPRIDDYLLAHQRFSPSLYSAAQYARSATFASDSDK